jgi:hypothetical protein
MPERTSRLKLNVARLESLSVRILAGAMFGLSSFEEPLFALPS